MPNLRGKPAFQKEFRCPSAGSDSGSGGQIEDIRIGNMHQVEPLRPGGDASERSIPILQHFFGPFLGAVTLSDCHENPRDIANHMMQEAIGGHIYKDLFRLPLHLETGDCPHRTLCLAAQGPIRGEIMGTDQASSRGPHAFFVKRPVNPDRAISPDSGARDPV